jgi:hypothetical protein
VKAPRASAGKGLQAVAAGDLAPVSVARHAHRSDFKTIEERKTGIVHPAGATVGRTLCGHHKGRRRGGATSEDRDEDNYRPKPQFHGRTRCPDRVVHVSQMWKMQRWRRLHGRQELPAHRGAYSADSCSCRSTYDGGMDDHRGPTFLDYLTDLFAFGIVPLFLLVVMTGSACFSVKRRAPRVRPSRLSSFPTQREPGNPTGTP